eukprot:TCALIF_05205-PA protein Name:"Similar to Pxt Chorion peroxidase (Drosophila melanogaster)" AED:0.03 eAED:0.03 QI:113/0.9/0.90/1/1/1/11/71/1447
MTPWIWSVWTLFLIPMIQVGSDHLVPLDVIDTPGSGRVVGVDNSEETFEVVPYHKLFTALLKKLELFRKSDPFQSNQEDLSLLPKPDRNTFQPHPSPDLQATALPPIFDELNPSLSFNHHGRQNDQWLPPFEPTLKWFDRSMGILKSFPAQPAKIRRAFFLQDPQVSEFADLSRRNLFAKEHNVPEGSCPRLTKPKCDPLAPYRSVDGVCNNLQNPFWGSFLHSYERFLKPEYSDGKVMPRGARYDSKKGYRSVLPSPRQISANFHINRNISDPTHSHMLMQFAQFIAHDITGLARDDFDCCKPEFQSAFPCFHVDLRGDAIFSRFNKTCMAFTRSSWNCQTNVPWMEQLNGVTSFIDASNVYGSNPAKSLLIRGGGNRRGGVLVENPKLNRFNIPTRADLGLPSNDHESGSDFISGDSRNALQPTLLSLHNLFLLEHNRIAQAILKAMRGKLDHLDEKDRDELLFQESRRILIAQVQAIVFKEFLPSIIAPEQLEKHGVHFMEDCEYQPLIDPTVRNEFSTAAYRFGHSLVQDIFQGRGQPWRLSNGFADPTFAIRNGGLGFENEIAGACSQAQQSADRFMSSELTNKLFANKKLLGQHEALKAASDLAATNIQRGRDHGIPCYNSIRKFIGLRSINSMRDQPREIAWRNWETLAKIYRKPDDIDLFTGGLAEDPLPGGLLGPTFTWLITEQFRFLMHGDRYFFTHSKGPNARGLPKLLQRMIMSRRLSDIFCENTRTISQLQRNAFLLPHRGSKTNNPMVSCKDSSRSKLNFDLIALNILEERHLLSAKDQLMLKEALNVDHRGQRSQNFKNSNNEDDSSSCVNCESLQAKTPEEISLAHIGRNNPINEGELDHNHESTRLTDQHTFNTCETCSREEVSLENKEKMTGFYGLHGLHQEEPEKGKFDKLGDHHSKEDEYYLPIQEDSSYHKHDGIPEYDMPDWHSSNKAMSFGQTISNYNARHRDGTSPPQNSQYISKFSDETSILDNDVDLMHQSESFQPEFSIPHDNDMSHETTQSHLNMAEQTSLLQSNEGHEPSHFKYETQGKDFNPLAPTRFFQPMKSMTANYVSFPTQSNSWGNGESLDQVQPDDFEPNNRGDLSPSGSYHADVDSTTGSMEQIAQGDQIEPDLSLLDDKNRFGDNHSFNRESNEGRWDDLETDPQFAVQSSSKEDIQSDSLPSHEYPPSIESDNRQDWAMKENMIASTESVEEQFELDSAPLDNQMEPTFDSRFFSNGGQMATLGTDSPRVNRFQNDAINSEFNGISPNGMGVETTEWSSDDQIMVNDHSNEESFLHSESNQPNSKQTDGFPMLQSERVTAEETVHHRNAMTSPDMELLHPIDDIPRADRVREMNEDQDSAVAMTEVKPDSAMVKSEVWGGLEGNMEVEWNSLLSDRVMEHHNEPVGSEGQDTNEWHQNDMEGGDEIAWEVPTDQQEQVGSPSQDMGDT